MWPGKPHEVSGQLPGILSVPISLGVLTTDTVDQALERAGTKAGNKGWDAALSVLEMAGLFQGDGVRICLVETPARDGTHPRDRSRARAWALQVLYRWESAGGGETIAQAFSRILQSRRVPPGGWRISSFSWKPSRTIFPR